MEAYILEHYKKAGTYTYAGAYADYFRSLPDDIAVLGRSRAGFAPYFREGISMDHWINQYYDEKKERWVTFDADGFYEEGGMPLSQYDMPTDSFDWAAGAYLAVRDGKTDGRLDRLTEEELRELDLLAEWMAEPDRYFDELCTFWEQNRKYRILNSPLVGAYDHGVEWEN